MLTDIFANRYLDVVLWEEFDERARRLLVQSFRIVSEQLFPYYNNGEENPKMKELWENLNKQLAMELGLNDLSNPTYGYYREFQGNKHWTGGSWPKVTVCENFVCAKYEGSVSADQFVKERLSFIEIAFRHKEGIIAEMNSTLEKRVLDAQIRSRRMVMGIRIPGDAGDAIRSMCEIANADWRSSTKELNERLRQADTNLNYHNGFIQISSDENIAEQIEHPFWSLVAEPKWVNVDHDMKEAIDLRDNGGRDPAWYAAKALESTIKIISDDKGWTNGGEKGAINYIDNLRAKKNGEFINAWEHESLAKFFSTVRNPFGHGAGSNKMPELSAHQTDWAIGFCMIWIKHLIRKL